MGIFLHDDCNCISTTHPALQLPEIVSIIVQHLADNISAANNRKQFNHIRPCLFVNRLWHDCAARVIYNNLVFEDTQFGHAAMARFAALLSNTLPFIVTTQDTFPRPSIFSFVLHNCCQNHPVSNDPILAERLAVYRRSVRSLTIRRIKDQGIADLLKCAGQHLNHLRKLELYICDPATDPVVIPFLQSQKLTSLTLAGCSRITDDLIHQVALNCPQLQVLDVRACGKVSDDAICAIARHCPRLQHLNVGRVRERNRITGRSICLIAQYTQVTVLGLAGCDITDHCIEMLAQSRHRHLERISVNNCYRLTNNSLHALWRYCHRLVVFEMKECHLINDWETVAQLVERNVLLTLCEQQNRACAAWAKSVGRKLLVKAPVK